MKAQEVIFEADKLIPAARFVHFEDEYLTRSRTPRVSFGRGRAHDERRSANADAESSKTTSEEREDFARAMKWQEDIRPLTTPEAMAARERRALALPLAILQLEASTNRTRPFRESRSPNEGSSNSESALPGDPLPPIEPRSPDVPCPTEQQMNGRRDVPAHVKLPSGKAPMPRAHLSTMHEMFLEICNKNKDPICSELPDTHRINGTDSTRSHYTSGEASTSRPFTTPRDDIEPFTAKETVSDKNRNNLTDLDEKSDDHRNKSPGMIKDSRNLTDSAKKKDSYPTKAIGLNNEPHKDIQLRPGVELYKSKKLRFDYKLTKLNQKSTLPGAEVTQKIRPSILKSTKHHKHFHDFTKPRIKLQKPKPPSEDSAPKQSEKPGPSNIRVTIKKKRGGKHLTKIETDGKSTTYEIDDVSITLDAMRYFFNLS